MTQNISPKQAALMLANGEAILIDVRSPEEFASHHIAYASSLPLDNVDKLIGQMKIPPERKIIFQCLKGKRGEMACVNVNACKACEGNEIFNMDGGIENWIKSGLPVVGSSGDGQAKPKLSIFRQVQIIVGGLIALFTILGYQGFGLGFALSGLLGAALCFAGITGWCGLAMILNRMPWNK